jgi:hypothetical protein
MRSGPTLALLLAVAIQVQPDPGYYAPPADVRSEAERGRGELRIPIASPRSTRSESELRHVTDPGSLMGWEAAAEVAPEPRKEEKGPRRRGFFRTARGVTLLIVLGAVAAGTLARSSIDE